MNETTAALPMPQFQLQAPAADSAPISMLITRRTRCVRKRHRYPDPAEPARLCCRRGLMGWPVLRPFRPSMPSRRCGQRNLPVTRGLITDTLLKEVYAAAGRGEPPNGVIMVRQGFPGRSSRRPITIADPDLALGTHFFSLRSVDEAAGTADWLGVTLENTLPRDGEAARHRQSGKLHHQRPSNRPERSAASRCQKKPVTGSMH